MGLLDRLTRRRSSVALSPRRRTLVASSRRLDLSTGGATKTKTPRPSERQRRAWRYFDRIGIVKAPYLLATDASSRVRLYPAITVDPESEPVVIRDAVGEVAGLTDGMVDSFEDAYRRLSDGGDRGELLRAATLNLRVPGEFVLLGEETDDGDRFEVLSTSQLSNRGGVWRVLSSPTDRQGRELDPDRTILGRVWRRHGEFGGVADSNLLALEEECEELLLLRQGNRAIAQSRIANAGLLFVSNDLSFGAYGRTDSTGGEPAAGDTGGDDDRDPFVEMLGEAMVAPIRDPDDPSAVVPLVVRADGDLDKRIGQVAFERPLTEATAARFAALTLDIARGLEAPPEYVLGLGDSSTYANARQIVRENYVAYIDPPILLAAEGFADVWLRPTAIEDGVPAEIARQVLLWRDPTSVISDPDRPKRALDVHKEGALSDDSLRRASGFGDDDAPTEEEVARFQERNRRPGGGDAGSPDNPNAGDDEATDDAAGRERIVAAAVDPEQPADADLDRLGDRLGSIDADLLLRLTVAASDAVTAALNLAGARLRTRASRSAFRDRIPRGTPASAVAGLLGRGAVEILTADGGVDPLFEDAFDDLADTYETWVRRGQDDAAGAVLGLSDGYADPDLAGRQEDDRSAGWAALLAALVAIASNRLYDPTSTTAPTEGEFDETLVVPPGEIRRSLAIAGGASGSSTGPAGALLDAVTGAPEGGVATGQRIEDLVRSALRAEFSGHVWYHGGGGRTGVFEPHAELDGVEFAGWAADVLAWDPGSFPYVEFLYPGDHLGCSCSFSPRVRPVP